MWVWLTGQAGPEEASATAHGVSREVHWHVHGRALGAVGRRAEQPWGNPVSVSPRQEGRNGASEGIILEERHGLPEFSLPRAGCFCFLLLPILEVLFRSSTLTAVPCATTRVYGCSSYNRRNNSGRKKNYGGGWPNIRRSWKRPLPQHRRESCNGRETNCVRNSLLSRSTL